MIPTQVILLIIYEVLWGCFTALQVGDVATTNQFLKEKTDTEATWISARFQAWFGGYKGPWWVGKMIVVVCLQIVGIELYRLFDGSGIAIASFGVMIMLLAIACIYYWGVVQDNVAADRGQG